MSPARTHYNHVVQNLQDYMFYTTNKCLMSIDKKEINKLKETKQNKKPSDNFFIPTQKDSLFWCFYIFWKGFEEYEFISTDSFSIEKKIKIACIEQLRFNKSLIKSAKLKRTAIEDELLNLSEISLGGLHALCLLHKINILYVWDRKYFEITVDPTLKTHIIICSNHEIGIPQSENTAEYYKETYWKIDDVNKPLKSLSFYKHKDLQDICNKLKIELIKDSKKKTKKELYEEILHQL